MLKIIIGLIVAGVAAAGVAGLSVLNQPAVLDLDPGFDYAIPVYNHDGRVIPEEPIDAESTEAYSAEDQLMTVEHLDTPKPLRALYMTSWVAGTAHIRDRVLDLIDGDNINAVVIDIKDDTGRISFLVNDPELVAIGSAERRIRDLPALISQLNSQGIYVIGRISVFQDPYLTSVRPDWAVRRLSDGKIWQDRKGLSWVDPGSQAVWDYTLVIIKEAHAQGFDEINLDYIRFPSDGPMSDISYPVSDLRHSTRREILTSFYQYLDQELAESDIVLSADLFGMTATNYDDLKIGQVLEDALPYFDYIAPMVYPSHYPPGFHNIANPNQAPYDIVYISLSKALSRLAEVGESADKLRPWLQDFNYPVPYTKAMVRAQIQATRDVGLDSWMLWDPRNIYTPAAWQDLD